MAVGDGAEATVRSYLAVGKEATFGTYTQPSTVIEAISWDFMVKIDVEKLDTLGNRGMTKRVQKDKSIGGTVEQFLHPHESVLMCAAAMGGGIVSAAHTTSVYNHSLTAGNFNTDAASVCFQGRKGSTHTWRYTGGRVNSLKLSANVGEVVKASVEMVFKDATATTSDDLASGLSISSVLPFVYTQGKFRYAASEAAAATTTAEEPIQGFELTIKNNIVSGKEARQLGSNIPSVLPPTRREVEFKITQRFDTTTAYNRFIQATEGAVELFFQAEQIGSTGFYNELTIRMPKVRYDSADVEVKGSSSILMAEIPMTVLVDSPSTSTGRDIALTFRNGTASY